jgi:hypothetical protein
MNFAKFFGWTISGLYLVVGVGYLLRGEYKQGLYFMFACGINSTVIW